MKQIIARNRAAAERFASGGSIHAQRLAYWREGEKFFAFERLPGERVPTWRENVGGAWWSGSKTVAQKFAEEDK